MKDLDSAPPAEVDVKENKWLAGFKKIGDMAESHNMLRFTSQENPEDAN